VRTANLKIKFDKADIDIRLESIDSIIEDKNSGGMGKVIFQWFEAHFGILFRPTCP
jgi:hypothetical protein